jgi:transcription initiation factor IIE alpha subunit
MTLPFVGMPQSLGCFDGPLGSFTVFFVCLDCGEIVTEYTQEHHDGHEHYYIGSGEEAVEFLNDILKDALKQIFKQQRMRIITRPRTPPLDYNAISERLDHMFDPYVPEPRVKEVDEVKQGEAKDDEIKNKTTVDDETQNLD